MKEIENMEAQIGSIDERIEYLNEHGLDNANAQVELLEQNLKNLENSGIEAFLQGGTQAAANEFKAKQRQSGSSD